MRLIGLLALIPTAALLTISFFVLVVRAKLEQPGLKNFGLAVAVLLWLAAAMVFTAGIVGTACGHKGMMGCMPYPAMGMMGGHGMMHGKGMKPCCPAMKKMMQDHKCSGMEQPEEAPAQIAK